MSATHDTHQWQRGELDAAPAAPPATPTTATHWMPFDLDWEAIGPDSIQPTPEACSIAYLDEASDYPRHLDDRQTVDVVGVRMTRDLLPIQRQFDGYCPGDQYWRETGERRTVVVRLACEVRLC